MYICLYRFQRVNVIVLIYFLMELFRLKGSDGKYFIQQPPKTSMKYIETRTDEPENYVYIGSRPNFTEFNNYMVTNIPFFVNASDGLAWQQRQLANIDKYVKENIWVHPDLQDTYKK